MKLLNITCSSKPYMTRITKSGGLWMLQEDFWAEFTTDEGVYRLDLKQGWISDYRSGSSIVDGIVPKMGNALYNATILMHDACYSGLLSKDLADWFLREGMIFSGLARWRANLAYKAVQLFGNSAYSVDYSQVQYVYRRNIGKEIVHINARSV